MVNKLYKDSSCRPLCSLCVCFRDFFSQALNMVNKGEQKDEVFALQCEPSLEQLGRYLSCKSLRTSFISYFLQ